MTLGYALILGAIQGITEFLPVSSSGHLVIFQNLLGFREPQLLLDITLHLGTLAAVLIYFRKEISLLLKEAFASLRPSSQEGHNHPVRLNQALIWWIIIGSIPTAIIGVLFKESFESMFASLTTVAIMLMVTGALLAATSFISTSYCSRTQLNYPISIAIGAVQGLAIIPGISRSGSTISCALFCGLERELAGKFSFLLSVPAILGALVLQFKSGSLSTVGAAPLIGGFFSSFVVGFVCLKILMNVVKKGRLAYFAPYCFFLGIVVLVFN